MSELGDAIRAIRQRRRITGVQLAQELGVTSGAITQYEQGRITPKWNLLLFLFLQAETPSEKGPIAERLQRDMNLSEMPDKEVLASAITELAELYRRGATEFPDRSARAVRFLEACQRIVAAGGPDVSLLTIIERWEAVEAHPEASSVFQDAAAAIVFGCRRLEAELNERDMQAAMKTIRRTTPGPAKKKREYVDKLLFAMDHGDAEIFADLLDELKDIERLARRKPPTVGEVVRNTAWVEGLSKEKREYVDQLLFAMDHDKSGLVDDVLKALRHFKIMGKRRNASRADEKAG